jgi:hypothetical protein
VVGGPGRSRRRLHPPFVPWVRRHRGEALVVGLLVLIVLTAVVTGLVTKPDVWAAWAQWSAAVGTLLAVLAALHIASSEVSRQRRERDNERREQELSAARLVTAEVILVDDEETLGPYPLDAYPDLRVVIINHGWAPVLHARVEAFVPHPDDDSPLNWDISYYCGKPVYTEAPTVLRPGTPDRVPIVVAKPKPAPGHWPRVAIISYTTADGARWRRTGASEPVRVDEKDDFPAGGPIWYRQS